MGVLLDSCRDPSTVKSSRSSCYIPTGNDACGKKQASLSRISSYYFDTSIGSSMRLNPPHRGETSSSSVVLPPSTDNSEESDCELAGVLATSGLAGVLAASGSIMTFVVGRFPRRSITSSQQVVEDQHRARRLRFSWQQHIWKMWPPVENMLLSSLCQALLRRFTRPILQIARGKNLLLPPFLPTPIWWEMMLFPYTTGVFYFSLQICGFP